jgi:hypothetical protein
MFPKILLEEFDEEIIKSFVQKNADYYLQKWRLMASTTSKISWNWSAFSFNILWLAYRKMYFYTLFLFMISIVFSIVPLLNFLPFLAFWIGFGMFGNYLYAMYTYKKLKGLELMAKDKNQLKSLAIQKGGTSTVVVIILALILSILLFLQIVILTIFIKLSMESSW